MASVMNGKSEKQNLFKPTEEQKRLALHDAVFYEILFAFGVSAHDETDYCSWEHVNFSRMGHARALYAFFETSITDRDERRQRQKDYDDVVSEDFGFAASQIQKPDNRKRLNKDLYHLTYARLRHLKAPQNKSWPHTILGCLHEPCVEFIKYLLQHKGEFGSPEDFTKWDLLLKALTSGRELRIGRAFTQTGAEPAWSFSLGRQLHSGRSELTRWLPRTEQK
jgi:hypothetical protein